MDAAEDDFDVAGLNEALDLGAKFGGGAAGALAADVGDDAERAPFVAAVLDLEEGPLVTREFGDSGRDAELLRRDVLADLAEEVDGALGLAIPQDPLDVGEFAEDLGLGFGQAAGDADLGVRGLAADPADELAGLATGFGRHGAGVDDHEICARTGFLEAPAPEGLAKDLGVVLVGLAAEGHVANRFDADLVSDRCGSDWGWIRIAFRYLCQGLGHTRQNSRSTTTSGGLSPLFRPMMLTSIRSLSFPIKPSSIWLSLGGLGLAMLLPACGGGSDAEGSSGGSGEVVASSAVRRLMDPKVVNVRELIDQGRPDLARTVIESFGSDLVAQLGVEEPLLRARISFLEGNEAEWLALVEEARAMDPKDPRPYATAVEIYAAMGRMEAARAELQRGAAAVGSVVTPELQRARGIVAIVTPGGAKAGLSFLEAAYRADDQLPFIARPLGQAYYLMAQAAFAEDRPELALERMEDSLRFDPEDPDVRKFYGKLLIGVREDFVAGLDVLEELLREGEPISVELGRHHWQAGLLAQVQGKPEIARKHYIRAKELGSREVESGTARTFMRDQSSSALKKAVAAAKLGDDDGVRAAVAEFTALRTDPQDIARTEVALTMIGEADAALGDGRIDEATGLIAAALFADRGARGIAEVQCALFQSKAIAALEAGETDQALAYATESTVVRPDSITGWHMLGELQYALGEYDAAAGSLLKATSYARVSGDPLDLSVAQMLAECQHLSQDSTGAVATLEQALRDAGPADADRRDEIERYLRVLRD